MVAGSLRVRCEYVDFGSEERMLPLQFPFSSAGAVSGSTDAPMKRVWAQGHGAGEPWCLEACMPGLHAQAQPRGRLKENL